MENFKYYLVVTPFMSALSEINEKEKFKNLTPILEVILTHSGYHTEDSYTIHGKLKNVELSEEKVSISLDDSLRLPLEFNFNLNDATNLLSFLRGLKDDRYKRVKESSCFSYFFNSRDKFYVVNQ